MCLSCSSNVRSKAGSLFCCPNELAFLLARNLSLVHEACRDTVRARLRVLIKDIPEDPGYPPDLSKEGIHNVLLQAEQLSNRWAAGSPPTRQEQEPSPDPKSLPLPSGKSVTD